MGKIYFGLVLTLLVSLLVMLAGGFVARRSVTEVVEVDRDTFREFVTDFRQVVKEKETMHEESLMKLADEIYEWQASDRVGLSERLEEVPGVRGAFLFKEGRKSKEWHVLGAIGSRSPAEVVEEGKKVPLIAERAVVITKSFFDDVTFSMKGRIDNQERTFHGWWYSPLQGEMVLLLIENAVAEAAFLEKVSEEAVPVMEVTRQLGEMISVDFEGEILMGGDLIPAGRVASRESSLGGFAVKAWHDLEYRSYFHRPTMWAASLMAMALAGTGGFLFLMQRKEWAESEKRVSFVNRVSHELGTPLTNMTLNLELASRSLRTKPEVAGQRLEKVREEVERLGRLVKNVLIHSRRNRGEPSGQGGRCDPDQVIGDVISQFRPALERRGVEVAWQAGGVGEMMLDGDALAQIVWNLISNVEKYAADGGWLGIGSERSGDELAVRVSDRGTGVPAARLDSIFEAFERIEQSTSEGVSGTGLGLTISRELARDRGGDLVLLTRATGAEFLLTLPMQTI
jgi:signal transduction histidine kinase